MILVTYFLGKIFELYVEDKLLLFINNKFQMHLQLSWSRRF